MLYEYLTSIFLVETTPSHMQTIEPIEDKIILEKDVHAKKNINAYNSEAFSNESLSTCHSDLSLETMSSIISSEKCSIEHSYFENNLEDMTSSSKKLSIEHTMDEETII
jgi:hypothetical protein